MIKNRRIYTVGGGSGYSNWMQGISVNKIEDADLVVFTGGEDICPSLYGQRPHPTTSFNIRRDNYEVPYFKEAIRLNKKTIGICRGAQLGCAMAGGKLIQHQGSPGFMHYLLTEEGREDVVTSSCHHQAQYPFDMPKEDYRILAWTDGICKSHFGESYKDVLYPEKECEVVYYPKINHLGIQGHPEMIYGWHREDKDIEVAIAYFREKLDKFMEDKL